MLTFLEQSLRQTDNKVDKSILFTSKEAHDGSLTTYNCYPAFDKLVLAIFGKGAGRAGGVSFERARWALPAHRSANCFRRYRRLTPGNFHFQAPVVAHDADAHGLVVRQKRQQAMNVVNARDNAIVDGDNPVAGA